jgi:hypothetical protein
MTNVNRTPSPAASVADAPGRMINASATPASPAPKSPAHDVLDGGSLPMRIARPLPPQFEQSLLFIARK